MPLASSALTSVQPDLLLPPSADADLKKGTTIGPAAPAAPLWMCEAVGDTPVQLTVQQTWPSVTLSSVEPVASGLPGGTSTSPVRLARSTVCVGALLASVAESLAAGSLAAGCWAAPGPALP